MHKERFFDTQDNLLREERFACVRRRADDVTASTFGTGVAIEQLLPGKLLGLRDAVVFAFLKVLYQRQRPFVSIAAEEDVERRRHQVQVLGAR